MICRAAAACRCKTGHDSFRGLLGPPIGLGRSGVVILAKRQNETTRFFPMKSMKSAQRADACGFGGTDPPMVSPAIWRNKPTCGQSCHLAKQTIKDVRHNK